MILVLGCMMLIGAMTVVVRGHGTPPALGVTTGNDGPSLAASGDVSAETSGELQIRDQLPSQEDLPSKGPAPGRPGRHSEGEERGKLVARTIRNYGFELTGLRITEQQEQEVMRLRHAFDPPLADLDILISNQASEVHDKFFLNDESVATALRDGSIMEVDKIGGAIPRRSPLDNEAVAFYRSHGRCIYAGRVYLRDHTELAKSWYRREEIKKEFRSSIATIMGPAVRPRGT